MDTVRTQEFMLFLRQWMVEGGRLPNVDTLYGERTVAEEISEIVGEYLPTYPYKEG